MTTPDTFQPLKDGMHVGLAESAYFKLPRVRNSILSDLNDSPAHCWAFHIDPDRKQKKQTPAMLGGKLLHTLVLEPVWLKSRFAIAPEGHDGRTTEGAYWLSRVEGRDIVTDRQYQVALLQRDALLADPIVGPLFKVGRSEVTALWTDKRTGLPCAARPDHLHPVADKRVHVLEVKSSADVLEEAFSRTIDRFGYHRQVVHYTRALRANGLTVDEYTIAAVSSTYPHIVKRYVLGEKTLRKAADELDALMDQYAECQRTGLWLSGPVSHEVIDLPAYRFYEDEEVEISDVD